MSTYRNGHYWLFEEGEAPHVVHLEDDEITYCGSEEFTQLVNGVWIGMNGQPAFDGPISLVGPLEPNARAINVLLKLLRFGTWFTSAIEFDSFDSRADAEELRKEALKACMLPEDWHDGD